MNMTMKFDWLNWLSGSLHRHIYLDKLGKIRNSTFNIKDLHMEFLGVEGAKSKKRNVV